ncbi:hypothetical protein [Paenibacillus piscarius]|uniref:hypothetical protein n=1 Tax=Paenibacillus piscarius TaxID=1089681 RepID=UPI001EE91273|nr:hypothetical protein [Paenibacillus piscarius]
MTIAFLVILLLIVVAIMFIRKKTSVKIDKAYMSDAGKFQIEGHAHSFIIQKDDRFEFLVEDGIITACKDRTRHKEFVYYGGKDND